MSKEDFNELKKKIKDIDKRNKEANQTADEKAKTWLYKQAIGDINSVNREAEQIQKSVNKKYTDDSKRKQILNMVDPIVSKNEKKLKELQKQSVKKELNRFNNKYWIDYTKNIVKHLKKLKRSFVVIILNVVKNMIWINGSCIIFYQLLLLMLCIHNLVGIIKDELEQKKIILR